MMILMSKTTTPCVGPSKLGNRNGENRKPKTKHGEKRTVVIIAGRLGVVVVGGVTEEPQRHAPKKIGLFI